MKETCERVYQGITVEMARCWSCGETKHYTNFYPNKSKKNGLCDECILCKRKSANIYREKNLEKIKEKKRQPLAIYQRYKRRAKEENRFFDLTVEYFKRYYKANCFYCDDILGTVGFDRVDNTKGYTVDNTVPCCKMCNVMKNDRNKTQFFQHIRKVYEHARMG